MQMTTWDLAAGLLQQFAGESQAAAIAVIAIEKSLAIARTIMNTATAIMAAEAIDPTGILAAKVAVLGNIQLGIIAATGLMQAANVGSGGAELGSPANPVNVTPGAGATAAPVGNGQTTVINLNGETFSRKQVKELLEKINENSTDGGRVVIA
jgi:hypothetical protein